MVAQPARLDIKAACALIDAGTARGTGFLVSAKRVLTCNHVIKEVGDGHILVVFPHGEYEATVELVDAENDCALLRLAREVPSSAARPLAISRDPVQDGASWNGYGFPAATGQAGLLIDGRVQDAAGQDPALRRAVVLQSGNVTAGSWLNGFSGSPVLVDGRVIGQMRTIIPDGTGGAQLAIVYACPADLLAELTQRRAGADAPPAANPYRGLSSFHSADADVFFGREELTQKLWQRFAAMYEEPGRTRILTVLGPSGSGKSSVALAGLLPALRARPVPGPAPPRVVLCRPGDRPIESLARALVSTLPPDSASLPASRQLAIEQLLHDARASAEGLRRFAADLPDIAAAPLLLVLDQFEEIYTLCRSSAERNTLVELLLHAASDSGRQVAVVLTLRSDFFGETQRQHPELNRVIAAQHELVPAMSREELRRVIAEPAQKAGHPLDGALVDLLLSQAHGSEGALPLLEFALTQIWEGITRGKDAAATLAEIGGVGGALARQAHSLYQRLSRVDQRTVQRAFVRMVQLGEGTRDTRRRVLLSELCGYGDEVAQVEAVLRPFADAGARLVTLSTPHLDSAVVTVEVTHEALFDHWQELRQWIDNSRADRRFHDRISEAARLWREAGHPAGRLWRAPDLDLLTAYAKRCRDDLTQLQYAFWQAALGQQTRDRYLRWTAAASILLLFVSAAGIYLVKERQRLEEASRHTEDLRQQLLSTYVERGKERLRQSEPLQALLWLHRAYESGRQEPALRYLLAESMRPIDAVRHVLMGHTGRVWQAEFDPQVRTVLTAGWDKTARLWDASSGRLLASLRGHDDVILDAAFSADGTRAVTASWDKTARLWDVRSGQQLNVLQGHSDVVWHAAFSPDGLRVITASWDKTARVWDARSGKEAFLLQGHDDVLSYAAFSPDGARAATASKDKTARLWDAKTGQLIAVLRGHTGAVWHLAFSRDGARVVTASKDKTARLWDARTGQQVRVLQGHLNSIRQAEFSPDGALIVTAGADKTARLWDARSGQQVALLQGHSAPVLNASFGPDGSRVVTASKDRTARLWDVKSGQQAALLQGHADTVWHAAFSPDGKSVITTSEDKTARVWTARDEQPLLSLQGHAGPVLQAEFSADGEVVATAGADSTARLWSAKTGQPTASLAGHRAPVWTARFSQDRARVVTASGDGSARVWDAGSGSQLAALVGHSSTVRYAELSRDGARAITASNDKTAKIWDARSGRLLASLLGHQGAVQHAALSPDGAYAVTASADQTARLWDARTGQLMFVLSGHTDTVTHAGFGPDGLRVVTSSLDNTARLWEVRTGRAAAVLQGHADTVWHAAFSPDGAQLVTASEDNTARLWEVRTGQAAAVLQGHADTVWHAAFSSDGARVITASSDKTARLWDATTGQLLVTLRGHADTVRQAAFSPDGTRAVTASDDQTARLWDVRLEVRSAAALSALIGCRVPLRFQGGELVLAAPALDKCPP